MPDLPNSDRLGRLLRAAARAPQAALPPPPFGLETRVLAAWREASAATRTRVMPGLEALLVAVFGRATLLAAALALAVALLAGYRQFSPTQTAATALAFEDSRWHLADADLDATDLEP